MLIQPKCSLTCNLFWLAALLVLFAAPLRAVDVFLDFESADSLGTGRLGEAGEQVFFLACPTLEGSGDHAAVGEGSLFVANSGHRGLQLPLSDPPLDGLAGEVTAMTVACWIRLPGNYDQKGFLLAGRSYLSSAARSGSREEFLRRPGAWRFAIHESQGLWFFLGGNTTRVNSLDVYSAADLPVEQWIHLAVTFDQGDVVFYVNGQEVHLGTMPGEEQSIPALLDGGSEGVLSVGSNPGYAYPGLRSPSHLDDFALFGSRALDAGEIAALYELGVRNR